MMSMRISDSRSVEMAFGLTREGRLARPRWQEVQYGWTELCETPSQAKHDSARAKRDLLEHLESETRGPTFLLPPPSCSSSQRTTAHRIVDKGTLHPLAQTTSPPWSRYEGRTTVFPSIPRSSSICSFTPESGRPTQSYDGNLALQSHYSVRRQWRA